MNQNKENEIFSVYNSALFRNMCAFTDAVWELNLDEAKVKVLHNLISPEQVGSVVDMQSFIDYERERTYPSDIEFIDELFEEKRLRRLRHGITYTYRSFLFGCYHTLKMEMTPVENNGDNKIIYISCKDMQKNLGVEYSSLDGTGDALAAFKELVTDTLHGANMGLWSMIINDGPTRFYADETVAFLVGVEAEISPEETYSVLKNNIDDAYKDRTEKFVDNMVDGIADEVIYLYHHPTWGQITVRCGGRIDKGYKGKGTRLYGYHQDVSEYNKSLLEQTELSSALAGLFYNVYSINLQKKRFIQLKNESRLEKWFGKEGDTDDFVKMFVGSIKNNEIIDEAKKFLDYDTMTERLEGKEYLSLEYIGKHFGWCRAMLVPVSYTEDKKLKVVSFIIQRIDDERKEELRQHQLLQDAVATADRANLAKTEFLSHMSHDIRTPMNAIIGMTAIAKAHMDDTERVENCLNKISKASDHLLGLINEVLDMSKIEAGKVDLLDEPFELSSVIEELVLLTKVQMEQKKHTFDVDYDGIVYNHVKGDAQRIEQVMINFISNAIKYTPDGGHIRLSVCEKASGRLDWGCYEWVIEDDGIGMSEEFLNQLFIPFSRAEDSRTAKIQGTGLGMAIAKNIVTMMNGNIKVESEINKGTKVTATIFLKYQEGGVVIEEDKSIVSFSQFDFTGKKLLIVEDNELNAEIAGEIFSTTGIEIEFATNGLEAFEKVVAGGDFYYDLILMDIQMPIMNGHEATRAIRALPGDYAKTVPIFAMTANAFSEDVQIARNAGMNEHIAKPLDMNRLVTVLRKWM